ncbi:hypothetical protein NBCG_00597 [Nocardioidaceae bacterium Broad-1]|nr:hypothetical protein NBCG_00597 [Nocardioidaceae bacterium Broad-1]
MEPHLDNPAGRLLYWLNALKEQPGGEPLVTAVGRLLDVDTGDVMGRADVMRLGASLADLCLEVREEVERLPSYFHPDQLLADFGQIENAVDAFTMARNQNVESLTRQIDAGGYRGLEMIDLHLHTNRPQTWISDETRTSLLDQVRALIAEIDGTDELDEETKDFILLRLAAVVKALLDVMVTGTPAIELATDALYGSIRRRPDIWDRIAGTKFAQRLGKLAGALALALSSAGGVPALMPADEPQPDVSNVQIVIAPGNDNLAHTGAEAEDDVVEAEIVEPSNQEDASD